MKSKVKRKKVYFITVVIGFAICMVGVIFGSRLVFQRTCERRTTPWSDLGTADDDEYRILIDAYKIKNQSNETVMIQAFDVADGLFCREIDGLFCRSSPDIIVRRRCVLSHKRRGWLQPSPSFRYSRNLALQDELYHPVINNGPAVLVCVDKRLGTGPVNQSRDAG